MQDSEKLIAPLSIDEVDFRLKTVSYGKAMFLAYKDARVDMKRLDAAFGVTGWQREHHRIGNELFCRIGIWSPDASCWVWKEDVGIESNQDAKKGEASDAFKRAGFNLGIGRELYDYPKIFVPLSDEEFTTENGKQKATNKLGWQRWRWYSEHTEKGVLSHLAAYEKKKNANPVCRFAWGKPGVGEPLNGRKLEGME